MNDAALIDHTLALVAERVGDPVPRVYRRLFAHAPEVEALFINDKSGNVRGEMFNKAIDTIQDLVGGQHYAQTLLASEWINHQNLGVPMAHFDYFFTAIVDTFREALGPDWTAATDAAWHSAIARLRDVTRQASKT